MLLFLSRCSIFGLKNNKANKKMSSFKNLVTFIFWLLISYINQEDECVSMHALCIKVCVCLVR